MKKRKRKPASLVDRFQSTCGWCSQAIPPGSPVFGGGAKVRPGVDLSSKAGQVLSLYLVGPDKTILAAVPGPDSDARRDGYDLVFLTCSEACGNHLRDALQGEIKLGNQLGLA